MKGRELEEAVLELVRRDDYRPAKARMIARRLGVSREEAADVKRAIKRLVEHGRLEYGEGRRVAAAGAGGVARGNRVVGTFRRNESGYGFVRPTGVSGSGEDIYVSARRAGDASTGDVVVVRLLSRRGYDRGPRGEIVEVVQRFTHQFVGTYSESAGVAYAQIDGTLFSSPIAVGDPGASGVRPGDKVVIEMVRFPSPFHEGEGVITEVLGAPGTPGVDTLSIIREFGLPEAFADDALKEARRQAELFAAEEDQPLPSDRLDATAETVITIDPADARDFDDAISLERSDDGHWRLGVHIADVTHFVEPKTALDREAHGRATSVYLPDRVIPMLPEIISNSLASLQPDRVRYTMSAYLDFSPEGVRTGTEVHAAAIKSARRFNYDEVDDYLAHPAKWRKKLGAKVHALLDRMHELAMILRRRRFEHGALEMTMPEVKIELDRGGRVSGAKMVENTESHQIIEEFMLAANEAVAELLRDRGVAFLRRIHEPPSPHKLKLLTQFVAQLGLKTAPLESRFELQALLNKVKDRPEQHAVNYALLRSMQRAVYSPVEEGHYALASDCYCHFTSPIRRYPDLTVHRVLRAVLLGKTPAVDGDRLLVLGEHCSEREQRAETAERELTKLKLLAYLSERIGMELDAVVTGVESYGLFVRGIELPAEGLVHISSMDDDRYRFDRTAHALIGYREENTFRLGDVVHVEVFRVDLERRELDFRLRKRVAKKMRATRPRKKKG